MFIDLWTEMACFPIPSGQKWSAGWSPPNRCTASRSATAWHGRNVDAEQIGGSGSITKWHIYNIYIHILYLHLCNAVSFIGIYIIQGHIYIYLYVYMYIHSYIDISLDLANILWSIGDEDVELVTCYNLTIIMICIYLTHVYYSIIVIYYDNTCIYIINKWWYIAGKI